MKLPISINTEMRSYPFLSNYFGVLEANNFDTINIRTNHYIRLNYKYLKGSLTFSEEKYIKSYFEIHNFFKNYDIKLLKEHIKNNEYVALMIDGSKLNTNIELINETHTYLVYGIEMSTQTINDTQNSRNTLCRMHSFNNALLWTQTDRSSQNGMELD